MKNVKHVYNCTSQALYFTERVCFEGNNNNYEFAYNRKIIW